MRSKDEIFKDLEELVWDHFLAKDDQGKTGEDRDKTQTQEHWNKYHALHREMLELKDANYRHNKRMAKFHLVALVIYVIIAIAALIKEFL